MLKINLKTLGFIIMFFSLIEPDYFTSVTLVHYYYVAMRIVALFLAAIFFLLKRKIPIITLILVLYFLIFGVSTYINNGDLLGFMGYTLSILSLTVWMEIAFKYYTEKALYSLNFVLSTFVYINLLFFLLFPDGYIQTVSGTGNIVNRYFLGVYNQFAAILIPAVVINVLYTVTKYKKFKINTYMLIFAVAFTFVYFWSATSLLGIVLLIIFIILIKEQYLKWFLNNKTMFFAILLLYMIIVVFDRADFFSFIIEKLLKKDVTLSTRTIIWDAAVNMIKEAWLLGYGYLSDGRYIIFSTLRARDAHNTFLQYMLQHGIIGMLPLLLLLKMYLKNTKKYGQTYITKFIVSSLFVSLIMMISEVYAFRFLLLMLIIGIYSPELNRLNNQNNNIKLKYIVKESV